MESDLPGWKFKKNEAERVKEASEPKPAPSVSVLKLSMEEYQVLVAAAETRTLDAQRFASPWGK
jgi:hypothetical protein